MIEPLHFLRLRSASAVVAVVCTVTPLVTGCQRIRSKLFGSDGGATSATTVQPEKASPGPNGDASPTTDTTTAQVAEDSAQDTAPEDAAARVYEGTLGEKAWVRMRLERHGAVLSGSYRYEKSKTSLRLSGSLTNATNGLELEEKSADGAITGRFRGSFRAKVTGSWSSADGTRTLPFVLEPVADTRLNSGYAEIAELGDGIRIIPQESARTIAPFCYSRLTYPIIEGVAPATKQRFDAAFMALVGTSHATASDCKNATREQPTYEEAQYGIGVRRGRWFGLDASQCMSRAGEKPGQTEFEKCRGGPVIVSLDTGEPVSLFAKLSSEGKGRLQNRCRVIYIQDPNRSEDEPSHASGNGAACNPECRAFANKLVLTGTLTLDRKGIVASTQSPPDPNEETSDYMMSKSHYQCHIPEAEAKGYFEPGPLVDELFP